MGLQEKRAIQEAQEKWLPKRKQELQAFAGTEIAYEVAWDGFADDAKGINWLENNGPEIVAQAFRVLCGDQVGKDAVKAAVKKVLFKNTKEAKDKKLSFESGTLEVCCAYALSPGGRFTHHDIKKFLEEKL